MDFREQIHLIVLRAQREALRWERFTPEQRENLRQIEQENIPEEDRTPILRERTTLGTIFRILPFWMKD